MVWADLKRYIRKKKCQTISDLVRNVRRYEKKMNSKYCRKYILHLKKVLREIILRKGKWSDY